MLFYNKVNVSCNFNIGAAHDINSIVECKGSAAPKMANILAEPGKEFSFRKAATHRPACLLKVNLTSYPESISNIATSYPNMKRETSLSKFLLRKLKLEWKYGTKYSRMDQVKFVKDSF